MGGPSAAAAAALFVLAGVVGPGIAALRLLRLPVDAGLVLPLGLVFTTASYWLGLRIGAPWLFPAVALVLDLTLLRRRAAPVPPVGPQARGALPALIAVVALLAVAEYPYNRVRGDGAFVIDTPRKVDQAFHAGLAWELSQTPDPQVPGLSGVPLHYHIGWPLFRAAALRWAGTQPYDAISRVEPTLSAAALILALRSAAQAAGGGPFAVALVGWSLLAGDAGFLLGGGPDYWRTREMTDLSNSLYPATVLALGVAIALRRFLDGRRREWLVIAAALALAAPFFKVFVGAQLAAALLAAGLLARPRAPTLGLAAAAGMATAALAAASSGAGRVAVTFEPFHPAYVDRTLLGLDPPGGWGDAAWALAWVLAILGLRAVGAWAALRALVDREPVRGALAALALIGWPLAMLLRLGLVEYVPGRTIPDESLYFMHCSNLVLWLFVAAWAERLPPRRAPRLAAAAAALALAVPSTAEYAWARATFDAERAPGSVLEAMRALQEQSEPGAVVMQRPRALRFPPPPMVFAGRRVPHTQFIPYLTQFAPGEEVDARLREVQRFFETPDADEALAIARRLGATHLVLYGSESVAFPLDALRETYDGEAVRIFALPEAPAP